MEEINDKKNIYMNYKRQNKWLGIIDYKSMVCILIYTFGIIYFLSLVNINLEIRIYIFFVLVIPIVALFCLNTNNQNISTVDILIIILKYKFNSKIYVDIDSKKYFGPIKYIKYDK